MSANTLSLGLLTVLVLITAWATTESVKVEDAASAWRWAVLFVLACLFTAFGFWWVAE
jgi:hypothetical protein